MKSASGNRRPPVPPPPTDTITTGTPAQGKVGPNLTHFASRGTLAGSIFDNTAANVRTWLKDPPAVKPGSLMPNLGLNDHELDVLGAYLQSLK